MKHKSTAVQVKSVGPTGLSLDKLRKPQMFLWPYILFWHKESYLTIPTFQIIL